MQYGESDARNNAAKWYKEKLEEVNKKRDKDKKACLEREIRFLYSGEKEQEQLKKRRELMTKSLKLIPGNLDYALDKSFNSAEIINLKTGRRDAAANSRYGTYNWHRFLLGNGKNGTTKIPSKNVFCLEYFPYHSEHLSTYEIKVLENECPVAHNLFRDRFLELRLREGACVIARSKSLRGLLIDKFQKYAAQIGCFSSDQTSALSEKNIITGVDDARKDTAFKDKVMSLLKG